MSLEQFAVNVVLGDGASGRIADPTVTTARLLAEATRAKKAFSDALGHGDVDTVTRFMTSEAGKLRRAISGIEDATPNAAELPSRLSEEEQRLGKLARSAQERNAMMSRKSFVQDISMESRGRNAWMRRQRSRGNGTSRHVVGSYLPLLPRSVEVLKARGCGNRGSRECRW